MDKFVESINTAVPLSVEEWAMLTSFSALGKSVFLKKGEHLLEPGNVNDILVFVSSGILRHYVTDANGNEKIVRLYMDGRVFDDCAKIAAPIDYGIQAIEDSELLCFSQHDILESAMQFSMLERVGGALAIKNMQLDNEHIALLMKYTPEERYKYIIENRPELVQRLSVTHLAQYLDMSRETLSRIRAKVFEHGVL